MQLRCEIGSFVAMHSHEVLLLHPTVLLSVLLSFFFFAHLSSSSSSFQFFLHLHNPFSVLQVNVPAVRSTNTKCAITADVESKAVRYPAPLHLDGWALTYLSLPWLSFFFIPFFVFDNLSIVGTSTASRGAELLPRAHTPSKLQHNLIRCVLLDPIGY